MKTTNTTRKTRALAQKITEVLTFAFLAIGTVGSYLIPETSCLNDVVFFSAFGLAACFGLICARLSSKQN